MSTSAFLNRSVTLMAILIMAAGGVGSAASPPQDGSRSRLAGRIIDLRISAFQPDVQAGGRANTIAVHPTKDGTILIASESGGLFKSTDGGGTWHHIDSLGPYFTNSVTFLPKHPNVAIVTTSEDFSATNQGGIWRSEDEGDTWKPVNWSASGSAGPNTKLRTSPNPSGITSRYSAFEISVAPDTGAIFVASTAGVEVGSEDGSIWTHRSPGAAALPLIAVLALAEQKPGQGSTVIAGSAAGVWRSTDGGAHWVQDNPGPGCTSLTQPVWWPSGCIMDMHAFGASPVAKDEAYVVNQDREIYHTYVNAQGVLTWDLIAQTPGFNSGCGGIAFVQARLSPAIPGAPAPNLLLYFGDRCLVYRLTAPPAAGTNTYDYKKNPLKPLSTDHDDTRHIAFNSRNIPLLLASDGGLQATSDGGDNWHFIGGGADGYDALQIYQVKGQLIQDIGRQNLYFGTQDNHCFSSQDFGKNWQEACNEGDFFEAMPIVPTTADAQITFWAKSENFRIKGLLLTDPIQHWNDPPEQIPYGDTSAAWVGRPKIVEKNFHVQWVEDKLIINYSGGKPEPEVLRRKGLAVTYSLSEPTTSDPDGWQQYAVISDLSQCGNCDRRDLPRVSYPPNAEPILYQALARDGPNQLEHSSLARLVPNPNGDDASTEYPAMNGFGGFGIPPTMEGWFRVFAVDPKNAKYLIAADVINESMMESTDGGENWNKMQPLTSLVTNAGKLNFRGRIFFSQKPGSVGFNPITQVSALSFNPINPDHVAVGTVQNGIFVSINHGKTWEKVPGSERATLISSLYWRTLDEIIVSTYGRGLWRVNFNIVNGQRCTECIHILYEKPPKQRPSPEDLTILAYDGEIRGVSLRDGKLQEVFVRPGTSLAFVEDLLETPKILVTETMAPLTSLGAATLPDAPAGAPVISGLTVRKVGNETELVEVLFAPRPLSMFTPPAAGPAIASPSLPAPRWSGPTFEVLSGPEVTAGDPIEIKGSGLAAGTEVEIQFDKITAQKMVADKNGNFAVSLTAPPVWGFHFLGLRVGGTVVNGAIVSIRPGE